VQCSAPCPILSFVAFTTRINKKSTGVGFWVLGFGGQKHAWEQDSVVDTANTALEIIWWEIEPKR
jgi:hypothetical protein